MFAFVGLLIVAMGFLTLFFGDLPVGRKGGSLMRGVSWPEGKAKWLKIPMGLALIVAGVTIIARAFGF